MKIETHNGKAVAYIGSADDEWGIFAKATGSTMTAEVSYHGDHDEWWIVRRINGVEVARYNCRHIQTIDWVVPEDFVTQGRAES